jgi:hypothetical protein
MSHYPEGGILKVLSEKSGVLHQIFRFAQNDKPKSKIEYFIWKIKFYFVLLFSQRPNEDYAQRKGNFRK